MPSIPFQTAELFIVGNVCSDARFAHFTTLWNTKHLRLLTAEYVALPNWFQSSFDLKARAILFWRLLQ